ncbi:MAG TPA: glutamate-cysteine ligase family protein, partial [Solirubrobacteraceae bacterium]|nr:glutamate-cysteine ligase family protein [Solirubrobacteraceae bacterium]
MPDSLPTAAELRAAFDRHDAVTVGLEEELMLLDPETFDLWPHANEAVAALDDPRFKIEMPAAQLEIVTAPHATVADAAAELADARRTLARRCCVAGAGAHPFASGVGPLNPGPRYEAIGAEYASVARRQLVFGLHVHVAVRGAERA